MSNPDPSPDEVHPEYDFSSGVRGRYAKRFASGSNVVVLDPNLAEAYPTAEAVNAALRAHLREHGATRADTER